MYVSINPDLVRDSHALAQEATNVSRFLLREAYESQADEELVTLEMSREGAILLSTLLHQLVSVITNTTSS